MLKKDYKRPKPIVLMILDGLGVASPNAGNAVTLAKTPNLDSYWSRYPHCYLHASGNSVGLPAGTVGNSEVGHMSLAAGKIVFQEIARIDREIAQKTFYKNEIFREALTHARNNNGKVHLMGLVSDGHVHSSLEHLFACVEFCRLEGFGKNDVFIHCFTDGRDTPPKSAKTYFEQLERTLKTKQTGRIATIMGRSLAMDRDDHWDRTRAAYEAIVNGKGIQAKDWQQVLKSSYSEEITDEFIKPHVIVEDNKPIGTVNPGDTVIFFNYRADRALQLSKAFEDDNFQGWERPKIENVYFAGFSNYEKGIVMNRAEEDIEETGGESQMVKEFFKEEMQKTSTGFPKHQIFPPERVALSLGRIIADAGFRQLRLTESEKFPHVTYFFNCREKVVFTNEDRVEIPSPQDVATFDQKPEMSCQEVTARAIQEISKDLYDFILINFANPDMVAHTGDLQASISAIEFTDKCVGKVVDKALSKGGEILITSDHGNSEELINLQTGEVDTEHSSNLVPFIYASAKQQPRELQLGILADITPTILSALGLQIPSAMMGRDLLA